MIGVTANAQSVGHDLVIYSAEGNLEKIQSLLDNGANPNTQDEGLQTALHIACRLGHRNIVHLLIKHGANIDPVDHNFHTPLIMAVIYGHYNVVTDLINAGANVHFTDSYGLTALMYGVLYGSLGIVHTLINSGANIHATNRFGMATIMLAAIRRGNLDSIRALVNADSDVSAYSYLAKAALCAARYFENDDIVDFLRTIVKRTGHCPAVDRVTLVLHLIQKERQYSNHRSWHPEFRSFVEEYEDIKGFPVEENIRIILKDNRYFSAPEVAGGCIMQMAGPIRPILINQDIWDLLNTREKRLLIFHELIHCDLSIKGHDGQSNSILFYDGSQVSGNPKDLLRTFFKQQKR